ncbi:hypothetical protein CJD36_013150 [Flavipsychrobacter stenotrophus]|uniref:Uncharacterized protein n=1 Tax=Flavipsychrobacter stenotrophus TaxID=2077091 RepID=A0A2S7SVF1_9BACT|nr:hypothetical protein [Flavipsychrobacter stenotrophus]PQJ10912.1 hypothetical protein CJD36_013150 [Flavipsychrobacter stenotrophus]
MFRRIAIIALLSLFTANSFAQEFKEYSNGLIYSDTTMKELRFIVDSMNLKYKKCDPWKDYYSVSQAICNVVTLDTGDIKGAKRDIENNISFDAFCKKYPKAAVHRQLLVLRAIETDGDNDRIVQFSTIEPGNDYGPSLSFTDTTLFNKDLKGKWLYKYNTKQKYYREQVEAFFFESEFKRTKLADRYARMIQYADCMIDTNSRIFTESARENYRRGWLPAEESKKKKASVLSAGDTLRSYVAAHTAMPEKKQYKADSLYYKAYYRWLYDKDSIVDATLGKNPDFISLLKNAIADAIKIGNSDADLERWAELYDTKSNALQLKRNRIVVGGCSQDSRPRSHALAIARLSAETVNWDIFLRAHLDIMNDRFARVSDGSYAYGRRKTYIRELEQLEFDVNSLMMGISLRIENPSGNHYFGSIGRLGRALAESNKITEIETLMAEMISDRELDDYNRLLIFYLYRNCLYYIADGATQKAGIAQLRTAVAALPSHLSSRIEIKDSDYERQK